jgi:hypothetical protein
MAQMTVVDLSVDFDEEFPLFEFYYTFEEELTDSFLV